MPWAEQALNSLVEQLTDSGRIVPDFLLCGEDVVATLHDVVRNIFDDRSRRSCWQKLDAMADLAYQKMPLSNSTCWRRLYTDTCLLRSLSDIGAPENPDEVTALDNIARLDRAIIIAGAAGDGRLDMIISVIERIQSQFFPDECRFEPPQVSESLLLPPYSSVQLASSSLDIQYLEKPPSISTFQSQYSKQPFILRGYIHDWPAMREHSWSSIDYLRFVAGPGRVVPIEVGKDYRNDDWSQKLMKWDEFIASIDPPGDHQAQGEVLYLAQHNLLMQFPALRSDIVVPDYVYSCLSAPSDFPDYTPPCNDERLVINAWLGPKGTISPAHTDPYFNLYAQVVGRKTVWLAPFSVSSSMYPYPPTSSTSAQMHNPAANTTDPSMSNTSRVDVFPSTETEAACRQNHPSFWENVVPNALCATLEPGDLLFFPPGWWHAMRSEQKSSRLFNSWCQTLGTSMFSSDSDRVVVRPFQPVGSSANVDPIPSTSLSRVQISDALLHSPDNGATLDLTHRNLTDVGESGAEELATIGREDIVEDECIVLRLALGNNRLAALPMAFALLSRLRYLNLKSNNFSIFPDVLTVMPCLEILDISRNKIKRLPSQPGSLTNLRIFCLSRNKLSKLPSYMTKLRRLNILKVDHNPIEWPPKAVVEAPSGPDGGPAMKDWIWTLQKWMEDNGGRHEGQKAGDDSIADEQDSKNYIEDWSQLPIDDSDFDAGITPHARSFSTDSNFSMYSSGSFQHISHASLSNTPLHRQRRLRLHIGLPPSKYSTSAPPSRSPESFLPSPEDSTIYTDEDINTVKNSQEHHHTRNASDNSGSSPRRPPLIGKKSLPDLRTAKINFGGDSAPEMPDRGIRRIAGGSRVPGAEFFIPTPHSTRQDSVSSEGLLSSTRVPRPFALDPISGSPISAGRPAPSMDVERNSYFRRLSTMPTSSISTAIPQSLLSLIDAARSILFAVSQVYQTLQHYTVFAIDDRLSSVLRKVLDPASADMMQLINALDRFDSLSRKTLPPPTVCRSVIESCKDTVAVFGKAVGVLALQLKVLATRDDIRFLRQMLLVLYGATAELSFAWLAMVPHMETVRPMLQERRRPPFTRSYSANSGPGTISVQDARPPPSNAPISDLSPIPTLSRPQQPKAGTLVDGRTRIARRQAGSFSAKDVEVGKKLHSYEDVPYLPALPPGSGTQNSTLRANRRPLGSSSIISSPINVPGSSPNIDIKPAHSRQGSQNSLMASSAGSSPSISGNPTLEVPNSRNLVDKEALDAMRVAVQAAPAVWEMMEDVLDGVLQSNIDVRACLDRAKTVTARLVDNIRAVQRGDPIADRKSLREDAHVFVKTVVQLSNVIKDHGSGNGPQAVSSTLRSKMVTLTNATEEFVILLHVSSFSPSSTPRPYSPMMNGHGHAPAPPHTAQGIYLNSPLQEEAKLAVSLSRSRSARPSGSLQLVVPRDGPKSAMISVSGFDVPHYPRLRGGIQRNMSVDSQG